MGGLVQPSYCSNEHTRVQFTACHIPSPGFGRPSRVGAVQVHAGLQVWDYTPTAYVPYLCRIPEQLARSIVEAACASVTPAGR
jgi:hypothetical protein